MRRCRIEYTKCVINAKICREKPQLEKAEKQGGLIILYEYDIHILTSDIVETCKLAEFYDKNYIYRTYMVVPIDSTGTRFVILDKYYGIYFEGFIREDEVLLITLRLGRIRRTYNIRKLVSKQIFKLITIEDVRPIYMDYLVQIFKGHIDPKYQSIKIPSKKKHVEIVYDNIKVILNGNFRAISCRYGDKKVLYLVCTDGEVKILSQYPNLNKEIPVRTMLIRGENYGSIIVVGSFRV